VSRKGAAAVKQEMKSGFFHTPERTMLAYGVNPKETRRTSGCTILQGG
jgi:hypothetical protein